MDFSYSPKVIDLQQRLTAFMDEHIYPAESVYHAEVDANRAAGNAWLPTKVMEELKAKARAAGLWNLFLPESKYGAGLTNLEYAPLCEIMGRSHVAPEAFNCSAPDTGNMETLVRYATEAQQQEWLLPLLDGKIRSAFAMTEPDVASSDATNIEASIVRDGDEYVINRPQVVDLGRARPALRDPDLHGPDRPEQPGCSQAPVHDPGADEDPGRQDGTPADRVRLRPRPAWPRRSQLRQRACPREQRAAG
jgi:acyl-CoA dehydrogenase